MGPASIRGKYEIIRDILSAAGEPSSKTSIIYEANLGFQQTERYLNRLLDRGLIRTIDGEAPKYGITGRGREVLDLLKRVREKMGDL